MITKERIAILKKVGDTDVQQLIEHIENLENQLDCLYAAGVDNWDGYDYACEMMNSGQE